VISHNLESGRLRQTEHTVESCYVKLGLLEVAFQSLIYKYSQTCIKRSPLGHRKSDLIRQVTSKKRLYSYELFYDRTRKGWPFNTGDCLIEVTTWTGLIVYSSSVRCQNYRLNQLTNLSRCQQHGLWCLPCQVIFILITVNYHL
jgi:hypothetical protein